MIFFCFDLYEKFKIVCSECFFFMVYQSALFPAPSGKNSANEVQNSVEIIQSVFLIENIQAAGKIWFTAIHYFFFCKIKQDS